MVGVAVHTVADQFGIDPNATPTRMFQFLQDHDSSAFAEHEPVSVLVERPARFRRIIVAKRQGFRRGKTRSEEHTSELQSRLHLVCRLLLEKKNIRTCSRSARKLAPRITNRSRPSPASSRIRRAHSSGAPSTAKRSTNSVGRAAPPFAPSLT